MTEQHKEAWLAKQLALAEKLTHKTHQNHAVHAVAARYDSKAQWMVVDMSNGSSFSFPPALAQGLETGTPLQWANVEVSPMGTGLHWPDLDADLSVQGLLEGVFGSRAWRRAHAAHAGRVKSEAKAVAARANGAKGGRPRLSK